MKMRNQFSLFDCLSPVDYRYRDEEVAEYLSEEAFVRYKLEVEYMLVGQLLREGICSPEVAEEIWKTHGQITAEEVYAEEEKIRHDIRALVNCIRKRVSDEAKPFVHMGATSYDIVETANAARYKGVIFKVLLPALLNLEKILIEIALREAETVQIGRTHGQHAVPITFGFALAGYVSRLGKSIVSLKKLAQELCGKFSGACGAYNASSLLAKNPEEFELEIVSKLDLAAAEISTQIAPPETLTRIFSEVVIIYGILANLSDDMRHLQRTEIGEVGEEFKAGQVGSSTMPQKRNPINFENVKSLWKVVMPRMMTVFMDQISEHQRDLTTSASARTYGELIDYLVDSVNRLARTMKKLKVDGANLEKNFFATGDMFLAEPLYILLAKAGYPDAHEKIHKLTLLAQEKKMPLAEAFRKDEELWPYIPKLPSEWQELIEETSSEIKRIRMRKIYTGLAAKKARKTAKRWKRELKID